MQRMMAQYTVKGQRGDHSWMKSFSKDQIHRVGLQWKTCETKNIMQRYAKAQNWLKVNVRKYPRKVMKGFEKGHYRGNSHAQLHICWPAIPRTTIVSVIIINDINVSVCACLSQAINFCGEAGIRCSTRVLG
eukprot:s157_g23.t1